MSTAGPGPAVLASSSDTCNACKLCCWGFPVRGYSVEVNFGFLFVWGHHLCSLFFEVGGGSFHGLGSSAAQHFLQSAISHFCDISPFWTRGRPSIKQCGQEVDAECSLGATHSALPCTGLQIGPVLKSRSGRLYVRTHFSR